MADKAIRLVTALPATHASETFRRTLQDIFDSWGFLKKAKHRLEFAPLAVAPDLVASPGTETTPVFSEVATILNKTTGNPNVHVQFVVYDDGGERIVLINTKSITGLGGHDRRHYSEPLVHALRSQDPNSRLS